METKIFMDFLTIVSVIGQYEFLIRYIIFTGGITIGFCALNVLRKSGMILNEPKYKLTKTVQISIIIINVFILDVLVKIFEYLVKNQMLFSVSVIYGLFADTVLTILFNNSNHIVESIIKTLIHATVGRIVGVSVEHMKNIEKDFNLKLESKDNPYKPKEEKNDENTKEN